MNCIISHTIKNKRSLCLYRKLATSAAALLEVPLVECVEYDTKLNQHELLGYSTHLRGLTLTETKVRHVILLKIGVLQSNVYTRNNLLEAYSECSRVDYAFKLFEEIPLWNSVTWNLMVSGCNKNFRFDDSWRVFIGMHCRGVEMDGFTYGSVLSACTALELAVRGEQIYGFVMKNGSFSDGYVRTGMIDLFARCFKLEEALRVFYDTECENVVCWNAVVSGAVKNDNNWVSLEVFYQMCHHGSLIPNAFTFSSVFTACAAVKELDLGKSIHGLVIKFGDGADIFVGTAIVDFYAKCGSMCDAVKQFKLMPVRNVVSWTAIISGFAQKGDTASAVLVLKNMQNLGENINNYTVSSVLAACAYPAMFQEALQIHCWIIKNGFQIDPVVQASLVNTYSKVEAVSLAEVAFAEIHDLKQSGIWANMISAFVESKNYEKAIIYFKKMLKDGIIPDKFSASVILTAIDSLTFGRQVHAYFLKAGLVSEISVGSSVFMMYSKCGNLEESLKAFELLESKDYVSWTSMIAGFVEHGCADRAVQLFQEMRYECSVPDEKVLSAVLNACSALHSLNLGREIHGFSLRCGFAQHFIIDYALVNMYSKCADLNSARTVFHMMPFKGLIARSSLISGFAKMGCVDEAVELLHDIHRSDMRVDAFTMSSVLAVLAASSKAGIGTQLHGHIIKVGLESESFLGSSLVMMYSKCGSINECHEVFQNISSPDLVTWTTMIVSYADHGKGFEALELFELMKKSGIKPDAATFVGVLSACSHSGLVVEGYSHLNSMIKEYGIKPGYKHYTCMVDLLGRAGRLEEAKNFILSMPSEYDTLLWETLLAACKVHGHHELGKLAAEKIMKLQPADAGAYVSVSNICAEAGDWKDVLKIRDSMKKVPLKKMEPGWSSV